MPVDKLHTAVIDADERRYMALFNRDIPSLDRLLADELVHTHANGLSQNKHEFIEAVSGGVLRFKTSARSNEVVRTYGDIAVHTGRARTEVTVKGEDISMETVFVMVWVLREERWQLVQWQATRLQN